MASTNLKTAGSRTSVRCYCTFDSPNNGGIPDEMLGNGVRRHSSPNLANLTLIPPEPSEGRRSDTSNSNSNGSTEVIHDVMDVPPVDTFSTATVLNYCKRRILAPYQKFLAILGWRPFVPVLDANVCTQIAVHVYTILVVLFTILGYVLQYAACFRRDMVGGYKPLEANVYGDDSPKAVVCKGTPIGLYFIPDLIHLAAYCYTYFLLRVCDSEQMQTLMERVFLLAFYSRSNYITQTKLVRSLRIYLCSSLFWMILSTSVQILHVVAEFPIFTWMKPDQDGEIILITLLVLSLAWNDVIHVTITVSYAIQCKLLNSFIRGLCERVREKSISLQEAIKEMGQSAKMLKHLNEEFSIPAALMLLHSGVMSISGLIWAITFFNNFKSMEKIALATNILCLTTWLLIFFFPLVQAARLSATCNCLKKLGQFLHTRPFGYTEFPQQKLDSFLLYTSSLDMQAKLFRVPIKPAFLFGIGAASCFVLLLLIQLEIVKIGE